MTGKTDYPMTSESIFPCCLEFRVHYYLVPCFWAQSTPQWNGGQEAEREWKRIDVYPNDLLLNPSQGSSLSIPVQQELISGLTHE